MQFSTKTILISALFFFASSSIQAAPVISQETSASKEARSDHIANIDLNIPDLIQAGLHARGTEDDEMAKRLIIPAFLSHLISGKEGEIQVRDANVSGAQKRAGIAGFFKKVIKKIGNAVKHSFKRSEEEEDEMAVAKRLLPGLIEKLFGGKEALESLKRDGLSPGHVKLTGNNDGPCDSFSQLCPLQSKGGLDFSKSVTARALISQLDLPKRGEDPRSDIDKDLPRLEDLLKQFGLH